MFQVNSFLVWFCWCKSRISHHKFLCSLILKDSYVWIVFWVFKEVIYLSQEKSVHLQTSILFWMNNWLTRIFCVSISRKVGTLTKHFQSCSTSSVSCMLWCFFVTTTPLFQFSFLLLFLFAFVHISVCFSIISSVYYFYIHTIPEGFSVMFLSDNISSSFSRDTNQKKKRKVNYNDNCFLSKPTFYLYFYLVWFSHS